MGVKSVLEALLELGRFERRQVKVVLGELVYSHLLRPATHEQQRGGLRVSKFRQHFAQLLHQAALLGVAQDVQVGEDEDAAFSAPAAGFQPAAQEELDFFWGGGRRREEHLSRLGEAATAEEDAESGVNHKLRRFRGRHKERQSALAVGIDRNEHVSEDEGGITNTHT